VTDDGTKKTDDVAGMATTPPEELDDTAENDAVEVDPDSTADPPAEVADLAAACVRFVATRYGIHLDFLPETLSMVDQWVRDARDELKERPELVDLVQTSAGAYLGEVIRRAFGAQWIVDSEYAAWRLCMSTVYCAFNPIGMVREALMLGEAEAWHAHFELDPGEKESIEARLAALPEVGQDEYYAPSTRFDVVNIVVDALRENMRSAGLSDVRFTAGDYAGV
jgi:hypothetical protein